MDDPHRATPPHRRRAAAQRRNRAAVFVAAFYVLLFVALVWPVYPMFATIQPRVLAMPFSLAYVVIGLLLSFFVLFVFYRWERGTGAGPAGGGPAGGGND